MDLLSFLSILTHTSTLQCTSSLVTCLSQTFAMEQSPCPRPCCIVFLHIYNSLTQDVWPKRVSLCSWLQKSASYLLWWPMIVWLLSAIPCATLWSWMAQCVWLAATSWGASLVLTAMVTLSLHLHFCGTVINHFVCEILSLFKLACSDTNLDELMILITGIFTLLLPFWFILLSYVQIAKLPLLS